MAEQSLRYQVAHRDGPDGTEALLATLSERFTVTSGPSRVVRRVWLDTFDRRLRKAGWLLQYADTGAGPALTLQTGDGARLECAVPPLDWPRLIDAVPAERLRRRLADVVWVRALLPVAEARGRVREVALRNGEQKLVARLEIESTGGAPGPTRLTVTPLRGYLSQAEHAARLLETATGLTRDTSSPYDDAAAGAAAPARDRPTLRRSMPAAAAVSVVLGGFLDEIAVNLPGTVDDVDTEFLHDLRVAVRRTRSALRLAGSVYPEGLADRYVDGFRWLGDLTTPTRDFDVHLLGFETMAGWLSSADPADLAPFRAHLRRKRDAERRKLVRGLRSARCGNLLAQWRAVLAEAEAEAEDAAGARSTAGDLAADTIGRAHRRVVRLGSSITAVSPPAELHALRKRGKELRYALEMWAPLYDGGTHRAAVQDLKGLQDCLGRFQDSEVQRDAITVFAEQMMAAGTAPAATVLAMGELVVHLDADQGQARAEFAGRFARFIRPGNRRRMAVLTARSPS